MTDTPGTWVHDSASSPRAAKSAGAFRTISEVSEELGVPQHVLRFWETKFPQVKPLKRAGGRRYYRPEDISLLSTIRDLLYREGFTIKGAQKHLRGSSARIRTRVGNAGGLAENDGTTGTAASSSSHQAELGPTLVTKGKAAPVNRAALQAVLDELVALRDLLRSKLA